MTEKTREEMEGEREMGSTKSLVAKFFRRFAFFCEKLRKTNKLLAV